MGAQAATDDVPASLVAAMFRTLTASGTPTAPYEPEPIPKRVYERRP